MPCFSHLDKLIVFLLQHLDVLQIVTELLRRHKRLLVSDPEHHLVALTHELNELQRLLKADACEKDDQKS